MSRKHEIGDLDIFQPKCRILAKHLIEEIYSGTYMPGQKMASIRKVAEQYGVGRQVVLSAFEFLAKHNYIYTEVGRGSFVNPKLSKGKFYRLGFYVNRMNPASMGLTMHELNLTAQKYGYELILGSSFEAESGLADWLNKEKHLDGVIITGIVDNVLLNNMLNFALPYVVIGNYDISEMHPQVTFDIKAKVASELKKILSKLNVKRCAAVVGTSDFRADREVGEGFQLALQKAGLKVIPELICNASSDGYREAVFLHESTERPDLIYIHGEHARGFQKYYSTHGDQNRPIVVVNSRCTSLLDKKFYDYSIGVDMNLKSICTKAIKNVLKTV
jgi:DNA-binding LacI/PurR family transcriptional regulator